MHRCFCSIFTTLFAKNYNDVFEFVKLMYKLLLVSYINFRTKCEQNDDGFIGRTALHCAVEHAQYHIAVHLILVRINPIFASHCR